MYVYIYLGTARSSHDRSLRSSKPFSRHMPKEQAEARQPTKLPKRSLKASSSSSPTPIFFYNLEAIFLT